MNKFHAIVATAIMVCAMLVLISISNPFKSRILPDKRPSNMAIYLAISAGMLPSGSSATISEDMSYYESYSNGKTLKIPLNFSKEELDAVYRIFIDNDFEGIKTKQQMIYDRGGVSISIRIGPKSVEKADSGTSTLADTSSKDNFYAVYNKLNSIFTEKINKTKKPLEIQIDPKIIKDVQDIEIDNVRVYASSQNNQSNIKTTVFDTEHFILMHFNNPKSKYGTDTYSTNFSNKSKIFVTIKDGTLKID